MNQSGFYMQLFGWPKRSSGLHPVMVPTYLSSYVAYHSSKLLVVYYSSRTASFGEFTSTP